MSKAILNFAEYTMLNEAFKSKIISKLFKEGEIDAENEYQKSMFNQVTDDEIIGIANDEEEAKKMLHDTLGDKKETRYKNRYVSYRDNFGDYDVDIEVDPNSGYTYNRTVDGYMEWVFKLNSGRFLVLRIEKSELGSRLGKIRDPRYFNKYNKEAQTKYGKKFQERKRFIEENGKDIKAYFDFKKSFEENGLWDGFVKKTKEELNDLSERILNSGKIEDEVYNSGCGEYHFDDEHIQFKIGEFTVDFYVCGGFSGNVRCWNTPGDYWTPVDAGCEIVSGGIYIESIGICVEGPEPDSDFEFNYLPDFDRDVDLCDID